MYQRREFALQFLTGDVEAFLRERSRSMAERVKVWRPTEEEIETILIEMRPIITEFARRARQATKR